MVEVSLFGLAMVLGVLAAILGRPRSPTLDHETLLKVCQSVLIWGEIDKDGGAPERWLERIGASILYSSAGRDAAAKLENPLSYEILVPALTGERAQVEDLRSLEPEHRFERLFADELCRAPLLENPDSLGADFDPASWLGHEASWEQISTWDPVVIAHLKRKLSHLRFVIITDEAHTKEAHAVASSIGQIRPATVHGELEEIQFSSPEQRVAVLNFGAPASTLIKRLAGDPQLRDRLSLVGLLNTDCRLDEEATELFTQEALDTEISRSTPWLLLPRLTPAKLPYSDGALLWSEQLLQEPPLPASLRHPIVIEDLGPSPAESIEPDALAKSLLLLLSTL